MKWIKLILISIFIITCTFLAFYKPDGINLQGNWKAKEIILDGKKIYPDDLANFIDFAPEIIIDSWSKTIIIPINQENIKSKLRYTDKNDKHFKIRLYSNEKSLNKSFDVQVDTLDIEVQSYTVDVKLKCNKSLIHFEKHVIIPPWKPEFPTRRP